MCRNHKPDILRAFLSLAVQFNLKRNALVYRRSATARWHRCDVQKDFLAASLWFDEPKGLFLVPGFDGALEAHGIAGCNVNAFELSPGIGDNSMLTGT